MSISWFFSHKGFYGNNYDIIYYWFLLFFPQSFRSFLHKHLLHTSLDFSHWVFSKIVFILREFQALMGSATIQMYIFTSSHELGTAAPTRRQAHRPSNRRVHTPPHHFRGKQMNEWMNKYITNPLLLSLSYSTRTRLDARFKNKTSALCSFYKNAPAWRLQPPALRPSSSAARLAWLNWKWATFWPLPLFGP
jgi:hypothetical protein